MTVTDAQVRLIMKERNKGKTQEQAAVKANVKSRKTVQKYEQLGQLPSELRQIRSYRTRLNPFIADWAEVEKKLQEAPELEAKILFEWLCERDGKRYQEGQLRTLQRHISNWRVFNVPQTLILDQDHKPGEVLQTDGTCMNELKITINEEPFDHILIHSVLPYSNWEWGRVAQSESLLAIRLGLQSTLIKLGFVPEAHQTDNTTAATHNLGLDGKYQPQKKRGFNEEYLQLLEHFGLEGRTIHVGSPNENGDIESSNGGLKQAVEQHLLMRGSRDFKSIADYEAFLFRIMEKRNAGRRQRLAEELGVMKPLKVAPWPFMRELNVRVGSNGILRAGPNGYTVPSGLKGKWVCVRIYEWHIEVLYANKLVESLPRLTGTNHYCINYRHVIDSLLRKPGGFRNYRYHENLFPQEVFHQAWETLNKTMSARKADIAYLRILKQAALGIESDVAQALTQLLATNSSWDDNTLSELLQCPTPLTIPDLLPQVINLSVYDQLLQPEACYVES